MNRAEYQRAYRAKNVEKRKAYDRARYQARKEEVKDRVRKYQSENAARVTARRASYYERNAEEIKKKVAAYRAADPVRARMMKALYRKRELAAEGCHDYTQLRELLQKQRGRCAVCRVELNGKFHKDHIVPLALGGTNWIQNIQFLCSGCNTRKNKKDPIAFMQQRGFLL